MFLSLIFDGGLAVLLIATITYCARVSRRLRLLQDSKGELAETILRFDQATERATASVAELQVLSKRIAEALELKIEKANFLADDLAFLIEKSTKLIQQLDQAKKQKLPETVVPPPAPKTPPAQPPKPFFETLPVQHKAPVAPLSAPPVEAPRTRMAASLEAVLQRLASSAQAVDARAQEEVGTEVPRTQAERELIAALKTGSR